MDETITIYDFGWKMTINLRELARSAGVRKKEPDGVYTDPRTGETERYRGAWYTDYTMAQAKKLLKLIQTHGREEDFVKCDEYFAENAKLNKLWKEFRRKCW